MRLIFKIFSFQHFWGSHFFDNLWFDEFFSSGSAEAKKKFGAKFDDINAMIWRKIWLKVNSRQFYGHN